MNIREISSIPPVERVISNSNRRMVTENISSMQYHPHEGIHPQRTSTSNRRDSPDDSSDDNRSLRGKDILMKEEDPQRKRGIQTVIEDPQGEEDYPAMEDPQIDMEEDNPMKEDPLIEEYYLMEEDNPMEEDPLIMEDHQMEMEGPQDALIEEDPQDLEDLLDQ